VWVIAGGIAALAIAFAAVAVFSPSIFPGPSSGQGPGTETAIESATSGPGHNTSSVTQPDVPALDGNLDDPEIPDSEVTFGRETSVQNTPDNSTVNP
jgi:hypothetical protein